MYGRVQLAALLAADLDSGIGLSNTALLDSNVWLSASSLRFIDPVEMLQSTQLWRPERIFRFHELRSGKKKILLITMIIAKANKFNREYKPTQLGNRWYDILKVVVF